MKIGMGTLLLCLLPLITEELVCQGWDSFFINFIISGIANTLVKILESISDCKSCYFMDLFVRVSNAVAISFYMKLGYIMYRTVGQYYAGVEDAHDMRKALSKDKHKWSLVPVDNAPFTLWIVKLQM